MIQREIIENEKEKKRRFEDIVTTNTPRIFKMIYNMIDDYETARDLTQDVFMNAWDAFSDFRGESSVYTWLYRIALNRVFQYRRKKALGGKTVSLDEAKSYETENNPKKNFLKKANCKLIKRSIRELPEKYQAVLILRYYEDYDYAAIAEILNIPIGTVRSRLHRGISNLTNIIRGKI